MKNITYTERNGILYPNLALPEKTNYTLGKYANLRLDFMKKHRRGTYTTMLTEGRLNECIVSLQIFVYATFLGEARNYVIKQFVSSNINGV